MPDDFQVQVTPQAASTAPGSDVEIEARSDVAGHPDRCNRLLHLLVRFKSISEGRQSWR